MSEQDQAERRRAAARWYAQLQAPETDPQDWEAFRDWERDPANAAAFREIERALTVLDASSLASAQVSEEAAPTRGRWRLVIGVAAAVSAAIGLLVLTNLGGNTPAPSQPTLVYATAVGEQRKIGLPDGSLAWLNTASRLEIDYSQTARRVILSEGQAFFEVAPAPDPFSVVAAGSLTEATGTAFDVRLKHDGPEVTLLEGRVWVQPDGLSDQARIELFPGERLTIVDGAPLPVSTVDPGAVVAWRSGIVQFTDIPLADAVAELNRYSETQIVISDADLGAERISGAFKAGEPAQFASAVSMFLPVTVLRRGNDIEIAPISD